MVVGIELPRTKRKLKVWGSVRKKVKKGDSCAVGQEGLYQAAEAAEAAANKGRR